MFKIIVIFLIKVAYNNNLSIQNNINLNKHLLTDTNEYLLQKQSNFDFISHKNNNAVKKKSYLKKYFFEDGYSIKYDLNEMYNKYKCYIIDNDVRAFWNIDNLSIHEKIQRNLKIYNNNNNNFVLTSNCNKNLKKQNIKNTETNYLNLNLEEYYDHLKTEKLNIISNNKILNDSNFIKHNIKYLLDSEVFIFLFKIIEQDLIDVLENAIEYKYEENKYLQNILSHLKLSQQYEDKIFNFLKIVSDLLNYNFQPKKLINQDNLSCVKSVLCTSHKKSFVSANILNILSLKLRSFKLRLNKQKITQYDIFYYGIKILNDIDYKNIKLICIIGLRKYLLMI